MKNKGFWMVKGDEHVSDAGSSFDNSSRIEQKRSHHWFGSAAESELFPNKKQAIHDPNNKSNFGLNSVPNQLMDRLFGSEIAGSTNLFQHNASPVRISDSTVGAKSTDDRFDETSIDLSMSQAIEGSVTCLGFGGFGKTKINPDSDNDLSAQKDQNFNGEFSMDQSYVKSNENMTLMGHPCYGGTHSYDGKGENNAVSTFSKVDSNMVSFGGFHEERDIIHVGRQISDYESFNNGSSVQESETASEKEWDPPNVNVVIDSTLLVKPNLSKNKLGSKTTKKDAPNSFPSNVRSLISTGMLDGVPVKYIALSREELRGVIKGSGYLCGCSSCQYSKVLNAYEFERHAGCKTKHPNNHIYFENGKTIYQIVQELRNTPVSLLFDAIQTVFGAPLNQKAFRIWKGLGDSPTSISVGESAYTILNR